MVEEILAAFPDASVHSGYVRIRCPYHKDGQERKPSMSILLEQRSNAPAGFCHCFACGKKVMLNELLEYIGQKPVADLVQPSAQPRKDIVLTTNQPVYKPTMPYRKSVYLERRGITPEVQEKFRIYEKDGIVYMPVFDRQGRYLYANGRSTKTKQFYIEPGAVKTLWGLEEIDFARPVAVCESQIDALSLWVIGLQAVATLGADNVACLSVLKKCTSTIVLAFDPDEAGRRATERAKNMFGSYRCMYIDLPEGVDINQALQDIKDLDKYKAFLQKCTKRFRT